MNGLAESIPINSSIEDFKEQQHLCSSEFLINDIPKIILQNNPLINNKGRTIEFQKNCQQIKDDEKLNFQ